MYLLHHQKKIQQYAARLSWRQRTGAPRVLCKTQSWTLHFAACVHTHARARSMASTEELDELVQLAQTAAHISREVGAMTSCERTRHRRDAASRMASAHPSHLAPNDAEQRMVALAAQLAASDMSFLPPYMPRVPRDAHVRTSLNARYMGRNCAGYTLVELARVLGASAATLLAALTALESEDARTGRFYAARLLERAITNGDVELVRDLAARYPQSDAERSSVAGLLAQALRAAQPALISMFVRAQPALQLTHGMKAMLARADRVTLVARICALDDALSLGTCILLGLPMDWCNSTGRTLLHAACASHAIACVTFLVSKGVDVAAPDSAGHTPVYDAIAGDNAERDTLPLLLGTLANVDATSVEYASQVAQLRVCTGEPGLAVYAAAHGNLALVRVLARLRCYNNVHVTYDALLAVLSFNQLETMREIMTVSEFYEQLAQPLFMTALRARNMPALEIMMRAGTAVYGWQHGMDIIELARESGAKYLRLHAPPWLNSWNAMHNLVELDMDYDQLTHYNADAFAAWRPGNLRNLRILRMLCTNRQNADSDTDDDDDDSCMLKTMGHFSKIAASLWNAYAEADMRLHTLEMRVCKHNITQRASTKGYMLDLRCHTPHVISEIISQLGLAHLVLIGWPLDVRDARELAGLLAAPKSTIKTLEIEYGTNFHPDMAEELFVAARASPSLCKLSVPPELHKPERLAAVLHWNSVMLSAPWCPERTSACPPAFRARVLALFSCARVDKRKFCSRAHRALASTPLELLFEIMAWLAAGPAPLL